jgi:hypothetical protein
MILALKASGVSISTMSGANKAWNKLCGHDRNYGTIPIFLLNFETQIK